MDSIKNVTVKEMKVYGKTLRVLRQKEGPVAGRMWLNMHPADLQSLTQEQRQVLEQEERAFDSGDWDALDRLASLT